MGRSSWTLLTRSRTASNPPRSACSSTPTMFHRYARTHPPSSAAESLAQTRIKWQEVHFAGLTLETFPTSGLQTMVDSG